MYFSTILTTALATASAVSALVLPRTGGGDGGDDGSSHGEPPAGCPPDDWDFFWTKCGDQVQNGLINVAVDACVAADVALLLSLLATGKATPIPVGVSTDKWDAIWTDCGDQVQNGLINVDVDACVAAEVIAVVDALKKRGGGGDGGDGSGGDGSGDGGDGSDCGCDGGDGSGSGGDGGSSGGDGGSSGGDGGSSGGDGGSSGGDGGSSGGDGGHGTPPAGCPPDDWEYFWTECGDQVQNGLINVGVDACVAADVALLLAVLPLGKLAPIPVGISTDKWDALWTDCGDQVQNGLINVDVAACVVAAVEAIVAAL